MHYCVTENFGFCEVKVAISSTTLQNQNQVTLSENHKTRDTSLLICHSLCHPTQLWTVQCCLDYKLRNALLLTVLFHCVFSVPITDGLSEKMMKEPVAVTVKKSEEIRHHSKYLYWGSWSRTVSSTRTLTKPGRIQSWNGHLVVLKQTPSFPGAVVSGGVRIDIVLLLCGLAQARLSACSSMEINWAGEETVGVPIWHLSAVQWIQHQVIGRQTSSWKSKL